MPYKSSDKDLLTFECESNGKEEELSVNGSRGNYAVKLSQAYVLEKVNLRILIFFLLSLRGYLQKCFSSHLIKHVILMN